MALGTARQRGVAGGAVPARDLSGGGEGICALCGLTAHSAHSRESGNPVVKLWVPASAGTNGPDYLMHRRPLQMLVDLLEVIEPLDRLVERRAFRLLDLLFLRSDALGENVAIEVFHRVGEIREHRELAVGRDLGKTAEHDHAL